MPWGNLTKGVAIGFCRGNELLDELNYLEREGRKQVYRRVFTAINQINVDVFRSYLFEALMLDEQYRK